MKKVNNLSTCTTTAVERELRFTKMQVSDDIVRRSFTRQSLNTCIKVKKLLLSKKHKSCRLSLATAARACTVENWSNVIWLNESKFNIFGSNC